MRMGRSPVVKVQINSTAGQRSGDWEVRAGNRQISTHRKKKRAVSKAKSYAKKKGGQVRIQNTNGTFKQSTSY